jgi:hypothetical protein
VRISRIPECGRPSHSQRAAADRLWLAAHGAEIIVVELHDALTAWLTLNPAKAPNRDGVRQIERQPGPTAHS